MTSGGLNGRLRIVSICKIAYREGALVAHRSSRHENPQGQSHEGLQGPDLSMPRPRLGIVPGKLGGSPHVFHTRLESQALGALAASGLPQAKIYQLYPDVEPAAIEDALDLERQLAQNLQHAAAA